MSYAASVITLAVYGWLVLALRRLARTITAAAEGTQ